MPALVQLAAHVVHYGVLLAGAAVLVWLLLGPRLRKRGDRVQELRLLAEQGRLELQWRDEDLGREARSGRSNLGVVDRVAISPDAPAVDRSRRLCLVAAVASISAAVIHASVCPEHFSEGALLGVFFAALAVTQLAWGIGALAVAGVLQLPVAFARREATTAPFLTLGIVASLAVVALWIVTRTAGLPWGILPGPEDVGGADAAASLLELTAAAASSLALLALRATRGRQDLR